jgi:hypothetical protein
MTEFEERCLVLLERIAAAVEAAQPKPKAAKPKADLFAINGEQAVRGKKPVRPMPDPFPMTEKHKAFAAERGIVGSAAQYQFERFKSHHGAKGSVFASWDQAWQTWVLNQARFNGSAPTMRPPNDGMDGRI